jgi:hypothetical protein
MKAAKARGLDPANAARPRRRDDRIKRREFITLLGGATTRCAACAEAVYSSERLRTTDFDGSCGTASTVVRVPASGVPRLSKPLLRAV